MLESKRLKWFRHMCCVILFAQIIVLIGIAIQQTADFNIRFEDGDIRLFISSISYRLGVLLDIKMIETTDAQSLFKLAFIVVLSYRYIIPNILVIIGTYKIQELVEYDESTKVEIVVSRVLENIGKICIVFFLVSNIGHSFMVFLLSKDQMVTIDIINWYGLLFGGIFAYIAKLVKDTLYGE